MEGICAHANSDSGSTWWAHLVVLLLEVEGSVGGVLIATVIPRANGSRDRLRVYRADCEQFRLPVYSDLFLHKKTLLRIRSN